MTNYNEPAGQSSTLVVDLGAERIECNLRAASDNVVTVVGDAHDGAASWSVDVLAQTAERTIALQLARLTSAPPSGPAVELAAARLLAAAQRLVLAGQERPGGSKVEADALDNLNATDLADRLLNDMVRLGFRADPNVGVVLYLCKLTALLHAPVYVYLVGPASSLKTTYADYVAALTPPEMVKHLTELTPRALYYGSGDLRHHVIALDELDLKGRTLALDHKVLRMLFSKSWCEIETTQGGRAQRKRVHGPVMVVQTTTATELDPQDESRRLVIELADAPERTDIVLNMMAEGYAGLVDDDRDHLVEVHRAVHRLLPCGARVLVPFAPALAAQLPHDQIVVLRAFRTLISLVKASALLHHRQRQTNDAGDIVASLEDYRLVYTYAGDLIARSLSSSSKAASAFDWVEELLRRRAVQARARADEGEPAQRALLQRVGDEAFVEMSRRWSDWLSLKELIDQTRRPRATIQRYLEQLLKQGVVESQRQGRAVVYRLTAPHGELPACPQLPTPEEIERGQVGTFAKPSADIKLQSPALNGHKENVRDE